MKKTVIALAVAASAAVSGLTMAADWVDSGTGGTFDLSGTLTPVDAVTPWEVMIGDSVSGLDANIEKGAKTVDIALGKSMVILGIRTKTSDLFEGQTGISPQLDFNGALDFDSYSGCHAPLTLPVTDDSGNEIGSLSSKVLTAGAVTAVDADGTVTLKRLYAASEGDAFYGGLGKLSTNICNYTVSNLSYISGQDIYVYAQSYYDAGDGNVAWATENFQSTDYTYSGFYGAGFKSDTTLSITLNSAAQSDSIYWKASLPITVSYQ